MGFGYTLWWQGNATQIFSMDKIIILTGNSERDDSLIESLNILFPECEIEIQSKQTEGFEGFPVHMKENLEVGIR